MAAAEKVRLHITPFNQSLFDAIVPKSVQPVASSISYHTTQSDPDRGFGYVELPKADADKLRNKLNGASLRGFKMSISEARPIKKRRRDSEDAGDVPEVKKKAKKEKRKDGEIPGFELPEGRHVKRGWTETGKEAKSEDKKQKREKSKYIKDKELLFKTGKEARTSEKRNKDDDKDKKRKSRTGPVIVHEFEKTTKYPTFLRDAKTGRPGGALTFVDGEGWVNDAGELVEAVKQRGRAKVKEAVSKANDTEIDNVPTVTKATFDSPIGKTVSQAVEEVVSDKQTSESSAEDSSDESSSSSESDSSDESESSDDSEAESVQADKVTKAHKPTATEPKQGPVEPAAATAETAVLAAKEVHPLEKLYKRRKDAPDMPAPIKTSFSFFETEEQEDDAVAELGPPQTPFTQQDLRSRGLRSAAPTPDTAAIGRKFSFAFGQQVADDEAEEGDDDRVVASSPLAEKIDTPKQTSTVDTAPGAREESDFAKTFWEKRGDINRAWKKQRRDHMKTQRQAENRKHSRREY